MAILIEGFSVIIRNSTLATKYADGVEGYRRDCPNSTFCADPNLSRVGFMARDDADFFVARLVEKGFTPSQNNIAEDVALVGQEHGLLQPCSWLEIGSWGQAMIAWLAGSNRGDLHAPAGWNPAERLQTLSVEERKERLEFVGSEDNLDVYRDKSTGQKLYVGRTFRISDEDKARHNERYEQGCRLIEGLIILHDRKPALLESQESKRLEEALLLFDEVVRINPRNWAAMWLIGKIYQRLGDCANSLSWFTRAHHINPDQPDVAREASIAAMEVGRPEEAIPFCERAIEANPDDPGLRANLALALLFSGKSKEAHSVAKEALVRDSADAITAYLVRIIEEVLNGSRPCPHHQKDLQ